MKKTSVLGSIVALGFLGIASQAGASPINISNWVCEGNCGTSPADGVVTLSPFGSSEYGWISTTDGVSTNGLGVGSETTGSIITSPSFSADEGDELNFFFNYVTSDGAGFSDYAWAELLDSSMDTGSQLFTARTSADGNTVPGFGLPEPDADVTLSPEATPIIPGGPEWSPLGSDSGDCYASGCGYTDWVEALFTFTETGTYALQFGVTNWSDSAYDSGLAFDGATIAGTDIGGDVGGDPVQIPAPGALALFAVGLVGLGWASRHRQRWS